MFDVTSTSFMCSGSVSKYARSSSVEVSLGSVVGNFSIERFFVRVFRLRCILGEPEREND